MDDASAWMRSIKCRGNNTVQVIAGGLFGAQLSRWLQFFSPHRFIVVSFAGYLERPVQVRSDLLTFLGVDQLRSSDASLQIGNENRHSSGREDLSAENRQALEDFFQPHNRFLVDLLASHANLVKTPYRKITITNTLAF